VCPNCGSERKIGNVCGDCGADVKIFRDIVRMSDSMYNKGLARILETDLSGGLEWLRKSVAINRNNVQARNLLGLVQYEIGQIGEALKNWVISASQHRENNAAVGYIERIQKDTRELEKLNDSIRFYNQAIVDMAQNSDDMAIIKLKQAVDINPKFVDALNLLTVCYLMQKDTQKAELMVEKVLAVDVKNSQALKYNKVINPAGQQTKVLKNVKIRRAQQPKAEPIPYRKITIDDRKRTNFHIEGILCFIIGAVSAAAVMMFLINPAIEGQNDQSEYFQALMEQAAVAHETELLGRDIDIEILTLQIEDYREEANFWAEQFMDLEISLNVLSAFDIMLEGRYGEAADIIEGIDPSILRADIAGRFFEIIDTTHPILAQTHFDEAFAAYHTDLDFVNARTGFEQAYRFAFTPNFDNDLLRGDILYYLAWTYSRLLDFDQATIFFERMFAEFPDHRYTAVAQARLNEITNPD